MSTYEKWNIFCSLCSWHYIFWYTNAIEEIIARLGSQENEQWCTFELRDDGEVGDCLGIRIEK